jgi:hypothetical protein
MQIDLVKAELMAAQSLNKQLHEQLMDARHEEVGAGRWPPSLTCCVYNVALTHCRPPSPMTSARLFSESISCKITQAAAALTRP